MVLRITIGLFVLLLLAGFWVTCNAQVVSPLVMGTISVAITLDNNTQYAIEGSSDSRSYTVGGSNPYLIVDIGGHWSGTYGATVTYNGVALDALYAPEYVSGRRYGKIVAAGAQTLAITFTDSTSASIKVSSWNGVHQTTPTGTTAVDTGTGTSASVTVSSATGDVVVDACTNTGGLAQTITGTGHAEVGTRQHCSDGEDTSVGQIPGAASVNCTWTIDASAGWIVIGTPLKRANP